MMPSPEDVALRTLQALEGIHDELRRIRVAEGPCPREDWIYGEESGYKWTQIVSCNLGSGHTGQHCNEGPFGGSSLDYNEMHRWD